MYVLIRRNDNKRYRIGMLMSFVAFEKSPISVLFNLIFNKKSQVMFNQNYQTMGRATLVVITRTTTIYTTRVSYLKVKSLELI